MRHVSLPLKDQQGPRSPGGKETLRMGRGRKGQSMAGDYEQLCVATAAV
jgi:hypothetical protein